MSRNTSAVFTSGFVLVIFATFVQTLPTSVLPTCGPVCAIACQYGNVLDSNGCPTCQCNPGPTCGPVCAIYCEYGNVLDGNGCPTCNCNPAPYAG